MPRLETSALATGPSRPEKQPVPLSFPPWQQGLRGRARRQRVLLAGVCSAPFLIAQWDFPGQKENHLRGPFPDWLSAGRAVKKTGSRSPAAEALG